MNAIGDEKVVAWLDEGGISWDTYEEALKFCVPPELPRGLIPQSAYAELAADRDSFRDELSKWVHMLADKRAELQVAESQLAELRGSLEERCVMLDGLAGVIRQYGLCAPSALEEVAKQIRTLAAADGG